MQSMLLQIIQENTRETGGSHVLVKNMYEPRA
jgi:hypothetical protein